MKQVKLAKALTIALIGIASLGTASIAGAQYGGYGMGPGATRGGPGMMGAYGPGYGMGRGMMGGYGPGYGMGPGMMGGYGPSPGYGDGRQQAYPNLNSREGRAFAQTCSQCHPLPDPRQHSAAQWPAVIARMQQHMREFNVPQPGAPAIKDITAFLAQQTVGGK